MRITYEKCDDLTLIYIYLRDSNGKKVRTIPEVKCEVLFDNKKNWIGINILNKYFDGAKIRLPIIKKTETIMNQRIDQVSKQISLIFDNDAAVFSTTETSCNIDYNEEGFYGVELILDSLFFSFNTDKIKFFTEFRP